MIIISGCLGAAAPVTGAAADEYNLNVVDCNASVTVARRSRSSISVSGGLGGTVTPIRRRFWYFGGFGGKRASERCVWFSVPRTCWEFYGKRSFSVTTPCASPTRVDTKRLAERETLLHRLGSKLNRTV